MTAQAFVIGIVQIARVINLTEDVEIDEAIEALRALGVADCVPEGVATIELEEKR